MQKILVATDGSEGAGRAVDFGVALARATGAKLSIIAIVRPPSEDEGRFAQVEWTFADCTVDEKIARVVACRIVSMKEIIGDYVDTLREIERLLTAA